MTLDKQQHYTNTHTHTHSTTQRPEDCAGECRRGQRFFRALAGGGGQRHPGPSHHPPHRQRQDTQTRQL